MARNQFDKIIKRFGLWRTIHITLVICVLILLCTTALRIAVPITLRNHDCKVNPISDPNVASKLPDVLQTEIKHTNGIVNIFRTGLFEAATGLRTKPLANKTIERIKAQVKLQCVMEMDGQPVAYINIQGIGLKRCSVGDSINDLFTVLNINRQNKSVEISIIDHKVILYL